MRLLIEGAAAHAIGHVFEPRWRPPLFYFSLKKRILIAYIEACLCHIALSIRNNALPWPGIEEGRRGQTGPRGALSAKP